MLTAGTRLGAYKIVDLLGAGGMGEVYRARDARLGRDVAIKVLTDRPDERRCRAPAVCSVKPSAVAALSHPHICPLFDIGQQDGDALSWSSSTWKGRRSRSALRAASSRSTRQLQNSGRRSLTHSELRTRPGSFIGI